jgi:hypothetical protein
MMHSYVSYYKQFARLAAVCVVISLAGCGGSGSETLYVPDPSFFPKKVTVTEVWDKQGSVQWTSEANNPYDLASWIGLDASKVFSKDSNGEFSYSASARLDEPASSTNKYYSQQNTATVSKGVLVVTINTESLIPPDGTWNGAKSYLFKGTQTINYNISSGSYKYNLVSGQAVVDSAGKPRSSVATGGTEFVAPVVSKK